MNQALYAHMNNKRKMKKKKSWFMLELTIRTAMLGLHSLSLADGFALSPWIDTKNSWTVT
jgi:hypothetical protein